MQRHRCMCFHIVSATNKKKCRRHGKKERKDVLAYPVDLHERDD
jgi:hypothetical protein